MLHILLMILKITLWIILGLLGLFFVLTILVLFAPIKYKVDVKYNKTAYVYAKINFLILGVKLSFEQEKNIFNQDIRILGVRLRIGNRKKKKSGKQKNISKEEVVEQSESVDEYKDINYESEPVEEHKDIQEDYNLQSVTDNMPRTDNTLSECIDDEFDMGDEEFDILNNEKNDLPKEEKKLFGRIKAFFKGIINKVRSINKKIEEFNPDEIVNNIEKKKNKIINKINRLKRFWNAKCTVKTRTYLIKYIKGLIKHIAPRKVKGYVRYGFDEPYKTGQITGYLSLVPLVYQKGFSLEPDFYNKIIEADVQLKGRIRIGYIIRIALNINLWRTVKLARKIIK